jgi:hypothetical protein
MDRLYPQECIGDTVLPGLSDQRDAALTYGHPMRSLREC